MRRAVLIIDYNESFLGLHLRLFPIEDWNVWTLSLLWAFVATQNPDFLVFGSFSTWNPLHVSGCLSPALWSMFSWGRHGAFCRMLFPWSKLFDFPFDSSVVLVHILYWTPLYVTLRGTLFHQLRLCWPWELLRITWGNLFNSIKVLLKSVLLVLSPQLKVFTVILGFCPSISHLTNRSLPLAFCHWCYCAQRGPCWLTHSFLRSIALRNSHRWTNKMLSWALEWASG